MIVEDFKITKINESWKRLNEKHRFLTQDSSGYWHIYETVPMVNLSGWWSEHNGESRWVTVGHSKVIEDQKTTIIDLHDD